MINEEGISISPSKIEVVVNWPTQTNVFEIRCFLGLAGYYMKFVKDFSKIVVPLTQLTQKGVAYEGTENRESDFRELKTRLGTAPILILPSDKEEFQIYSDASHK